MFSAYLLRDLLFGILAFLLLCGNNMGVRVHRASRAVSVDRMAEGSLIETELQVLWRIRCPAARCFLCCNNTSETCRCDNREEFHFDG